MKSHNGLSFNGLSKNSHELKQKHIAGRWLRRVNKDGDKSIPTLYIKNYDDTVDKYQRNLVTVVMGERRLHQTLKKRVVQVIIKCPYGTDL